MKNFIKEIFIKVTEDYWREKIAQELESKIITWGKFNNGMPLHERCWKCGTEPITNTCDTARQYWGKELGKLNAKVARGQR